MFRAVPLSIIRNFSLYTQQWYMSYRFADNLRAGSGRFRLDPAHSGIRVAGCNTVTTPTQPHRNSNTHRTKNNTTNVIIQQNSRKLLMVDILMSETC